MDQVPSPGEYHEESNKVQILPRLGIHIDAYLIDKIRTICMQRHLFRTRSSFQEVNRDLYNQMLLKSLGKTILLILLWKEIWIHFCKKQIGENRTI